MALLFRTIADAVELPLIPYNIPARTGVNMTAATQVRLSRIGNIVGMKESSGDFTQIANIIEEVGPSFKVWSGNDEDTFGVLSIGGYGVVSVASHLVGRQIADMVALHVEGKTADAAAIHRRLLPLIDALFCVTSPIPLKFALNHIGFECGGYRLPLCEPDDVSAEHITSELRRHKIDLPLPV
jgi:4-hydroxy-tetrahydrodipicolinate synthase